MAIDAPVTGLVFFLELAGVPMGRFSTCSGLGSQSEIIEHKVLRDNQDYVEKIAGRVHYSNVVLERGLHRSAAKLWTWRQQVVDGKWAEARKNGVIVAGAPDGSPLLRWRFIAGWPSAWSAFTTDAAAGLAVERIEIAHEGISLDARV